MCWSLRVGVCGWRTSGLSTLGSGACDSRSLDPKDRRPRHPSVLPPPPDFPPFRSLRPPLSYSTVSSSSHSTLSYSSFSSFTLSSLRISPPPPLLFMVPSFSPPFSPPPFEGSTHGSRGLLGGRGLSRIQGVGPSVSRPQPSRLTEDGRGGTWRVEGGRGRGRHLQRNK